MAKGNKLGLSLRNTLGSAHGKADQMGCISQPGLLPESCRLDHSPPEPVPQIVGRGQHRNMAVLGQLTRSDLAGLSWLECLGQGSLLED